MKTIESETKQIGDNRLVKKGTIIAGPCSAESEAQILQTAMELAQIPKVSVFRAGIWKPRTNPGSFEGLGIRALPWLHQAKKITGLATATEVATPKHAEDALTWETNVLWIGARTSVNPFAVEEIASALRGTDVEVMIKNPVNPELKLWIGAVERLQKAGIKHISLIHRGFSVYDSHPYRNEPIWNIPIEMKRRFPDLPLIGDPSHISGKARFIEEIAGQFTELDYDGMMVETHCNPSEAITDREQQLTPKQLHDLLERVYCKKRTPKESATKSRLEELRREIDKRDDELLSILSARFELAEKIGLLKKAEGITVLQNKRYQEIIDRITRKGMDLNLDKNFLETLYEIIHLESIKTQKKQG